MTPKDIAEMIVAALKERGVDAKATESGMSGIRFRVRRADGERWDDSPYIDVEYLPSGFRVASQDGGLRANNPLQRRGRTVRQRSGEWRGWSGR